MELVDGPINALQEFNLPNSWVGSFLSLSFFLLTLIPFLKSNTIDSAIPPSRSAHWWFLAASPLLPPYHPFILPSDQSLSSQPHLSQSVDLSTRIACVFPREELEGGRIAIY